MNKYKIVNDTNQPKELEVSLESVGGHIFIRVNGVDVAFLSFDGELGRCNIYKTIDGIKMDGSVIAYYEK